MKTAMVSGIQSSIKRSMWEATSSSVGRRVSRYDVSLINERDETSQHEAPVQSTGFVEGQLLETERASTIDSLRLECDYVEDKLERLPVGSGSGECCSLGSPSCNDA